MAKHIKHYYVDTATGQYLINTNSSQNGKTHPDIAGLDVKFWLTDSNSIDYCLSLVPDQTTIFAQPGIEEVTYEQFAQLVLAKFNEIKSQVSSSSELLSALGKTSAEIAALQLDNTDINTLVSGFNVFSRPIIQ